MSDNKRETNTMLLEPEIDKTQLAKSILFPKKKEEEKKLPKAKDIFIERSQPEDNFKPEENSQENIEEEITEQQEDLSQDAIQEEEIVTEEESEQEIAKIETLTKPKKSMKVRVRLIIAVYIATLVGFGSWAIYNAVDNTNIANQVYEAQQVRTITEQTYESKTKALEKIMTKLGKLDTIDETLNNLDEANVVELTPKQLAEPTNFKVQSNWFDKFCNWVSKLFGG